MGRWYNKDSPQEIRALRGIRWVTLLVLGMGLAGVGLADQHPPGNRPLPGPDYFYSFITREEYRFYRSDFLPLSLAQKGRFYVSGFRGMPPGFLKQGYNGFSLENPVLGMWNEQTTPHHRIQSDSLMSGWGRGVYRNEGPVSQAPTSIITYFQDYITRLSYIDIDFAEYFRPGQFFQLAGNNFLRDGTEPGDYSKIQVNTYQVRFLFRLPYRWRADVNFWQLRHRFNMPPQNLLLFRTDRFKSVTNFLWIDFSRKMFATDSLIWTPRLRWYTDQYWEVGRLQRDFRATVLGQSLKYFRHLGGGGLRWVLEMEGIQSRGRRYWRRHREWRQSGWVEFFQKRSWMETRFRYGLFYHSEYRWGKQFAVHVVLKTKRVRLHAAVFEQPRPAALLWRTFSGDSFPNAPTGRFIVQKGRQLALEWRGRHVALRAEGFRLSTQNYPVFLSSSDVWRRRSFGNQGFTLGLNWQRPTLWIRQHITYNDGFRTAFAPRWNWVAEIGFKRSFFNQALKLNGIFIAHWIDRFPGIAFDRLLHQFRMQRQMKGPYPVFDFRLLARIRSATLYFVWENMLSTDYVIVEGTGELYRLFRMGIRWTLFD